MNFKVEDISVLREQLARDSVCAICAAKRDTVCLKGFNKGQKSVKQIVTKFKNMVEEALGEYLKPLLSLLPDW